MTIERVSIGRALAQRATSVERRISDETTQAIDDVGGVMAGLGTIGSVVGRAAIDAGAAIGGAVAGAVGVAIGRPNLAADVEAGSIAAAGTFIGAAKMAANGAFALVNVPVYVPATRTWIRIQGDMFEPNGVHELRGAQFVGRGLREFGLLAHTANRTVEALARPLRASQVVTATGDAPVAMELDLNAPGADWSRTQGSAGLVAIYVDGAHHSDVPVFAERTEPVAVNLGMLSAGRHLVEVRDAADLVGAAAPRSTARILGTRPLDGDAALVARYQPIIEGRDLGFPGGRAEMTKTDAPLLTVPIVERRQDGTTRIFYRVLFSNEDGGTSTAQLYRTWGRATDFEDVYEVIVDARGNRLSDRYQSPRHEWLPFEGERVGDRPLLRTATSNNNFSADIRDVGTRWSQLAEPSNHAAHGLDVMLKHPWTFTVMAKELAREAAMFKDGITTPKHVTDPRRYVYFEQAATGARDVLEQGGSVRVHLRDGSTRDLVMLDGPSKYPDRPTAILLPDDVASTDVVSIDGANRTWLLDAAFKPRPVASAAITAA